MFIYFN